MPGDVEAINSNPPHVPVKRASSLGGRGNRGHPPTLLPRSALGEERLIDTALYTSVALEQIGDTVEATVSVSNIGCGHAVLTGEPMRALVMVVESEGAARARGRGRHDHQ